MDFDELNVMSEIDSLYGRLEKEARKRFRLLFINIFFQTLLLAVRKGVTAYSTAAAYDDRLEELAEMHIANLLKEPNQTTLYAWDTEHLRKRDKAKESVNASVGKAVKQVALDKAIRQWSGMAKEYADLTSLDALLAAYQAAGVKRVRVVTERDSRVCGKCNALDGKIFSIKKVPLPQHFGCRCHVEPVT